VCSYAAVVAPALEYRWWVSEGTRTSGLGITQTLPRTPLDRASRTEEKSMDKNVLLVGRKAIVLDDVREGLAVPDVTLFSATTLNEVRKVFGEHPIDTVIMGAGIDLDTRLRIVRHVFEASDSTTVHMKDWQSGPEGFLPFVKGLLERPV
jgi:hypothetical protein